jgi:hypothetical protein
MSDDDDTMQLTVIDSRLYPPSEACLRFMAEQGYDPAMPVFRAVVTPILIAKLKADRPEVANAVQLLVGSFGIVDPRPVMPAFRVVELQVGDVVIDVEAEIAD